MAAKGQPESIPLEQSMAGVLALLVADRQERGHADDAPKTEVLLDSAGLTTSTIARLLGKNEGAVRKSVQRARKPAKKAGRKAR